MNRKIDIEEGIQNFRSRYFPIFICAVLASISSAVSAIYFLGLNGFKSDPERLKFEFIAMAGASVWITIWNFLVIRGHPGAIKAIVAFNLLCLVLILCTLGYEFEMWLLALDLSFPLLSLLCINSQRHREMRELTNEIRLQRERFRRTGRRR